MSDDYYSILGVTRECSENYIKKAYKKLAMKFHPDKTTDDKKEEYTQKFQKIGEAYEVLSDPEKRQTYDQFGKEGLKGGPKMDFNDIFKNFFQGNNPFNFEPNFNSNFNNNSNVNKKEIKKNKETLFPIVISLTQVYLGVNKKLKITRTAIFSNETEIKENLENTWTTCFSCKGQGLVMEIRQVGPGMIQQISKNCDNCYGTGYQLKPNYQLKEISEIIEINIPRGIENNSVFQFKNRGNVIPGTIPGDLIILVHSKDEEKGFTRDGNNLIYEQKIKLVEALIGATFRINHLDDRKLIIKTKNVIKPGDIKRIKNEGLLTLKSNMIGDLLIKFEIEFPDILGRKKTKELLKTLGPLSEFKINNDDKVIEID